MEHPPETFNLLEEKTDKTLGDIGIGKDLLNGTPVAQEIQQMTNGITLNYKHPHAKQTTKEWKDNIEWKHCVIYSLGREALFRIYKEQKIRPSKMKYNQNTGNWNEQIVLTRCTNVQWVQEKCLASLAIRHMKVKAKLRFILMEGNKT